MSPFTKLKCFCIHGTPGFLQLLTWDLRSFDPKSGFNGGQKNDMQHVSETPALTRGFVTRDEQKEAVNAWEWNIKSGI